MAEKTAEANPVACKALTAKQRDPAADTRALERDLDRRVYALYGLTEEEIKLVDPELTLSKEEYETDARVS